MKFSIEKFSIKYIVKKPIIYFLTVFMGISLFVSLTLTTQVPIMKTYIAKIDIGKDKIVLILADELVYRSMDTIYFYIDKELSVYKICDYSFSDKGIIVTNTSEMASIIQNCNTSSVNIDIKQGEISLFKQIFIKGGKG